MFNGLLISVFESDAGSQVTVIPGDSNDGPGPGPEECDTNINRSPTWCTV